MVDSTTHVRMSLFQNQHLRLSTASWNLKLMGGENRTNLGLSRGHMSVAMVILIIPVCFLWISSNISLVAVYIQSAPRCRILCSTRIHPRITPTTTLSPVWWNALDAWQCVYPMWQDLIWFLNRTDTCSIWNIASHSNKLEVHERLS